MLLGGAHVQKITLAPVLIQKGRTKLALYGLGAIREERVGRLFHTPGCVSWVRPASSAQAAADDWHNLFVLHQNRVLHGPSNGKALKEEDLPSFLQARAGAGWGLGALGGWLGDGGAAGQQRSSPPSQLVGGASLRRR